MALNVVQKSRRNLTSNKQPVEQETRKKASKNFSRTKPKANKQPTCNAKQEPHTKKKASKDLSMTEPAPKQACKMLNKKCVSLFTDACDITKERSGKCPLTPS